MEKISSKVLAARMEKVVGKLIHFDQTVFLKGSIASDNLRRLLHIIDIASSLAAPLAQAIKESGVIFPITVDQSRHYLSLYADDCLLFPSNIQDSLPHVLILFGYIRNMAGYWINSTKLALLPLNLAEPAGIPVCSSFTYLGIEIYPNFH